MNFFSSMVRSNSVPRNFNPLLMWALGLTLLLSAWARWWPVEQESSSTTAHAFASAQSSASASETTFESLSEPTRRLSPATQDPFMLPVTRTHATAHSSAPIVPQPVMVASQPTSVVPSPRRAAQAPTLFGRFRTPDGQWLVFLRDGNQVLEAKLQLSLPGGFQVSELSDTGITLVAADSGEVLHWSWPSP